MQPTVRLFGVVLLSFLCFWGPAQGQPLRTRLLRSVEASKVNDDYVVRVKFTTGMQYLSHIPPGKGSEIKISLGAPVSRLQEPGGSIEQERLSPSGVNSPLDDVLLDLSNPTKPLLIIRFDESVSFLVRGGSDFRSVNITFRPLSAASAAPGTEMPGQDDSDLSAVPTEKAEKSEIAQLYNGAREAYVSGDYNRAIQLATSAVEQGTPAEFRDALELLGMSREAKGQLAHATAEYERYIELYGDTEDVSRVKQRLDAMLTASLPASATPAKDQATAAEEEASGWRYRRSGGASVYYNNDRIKLDGAPSETARSSLLSDANISTRSSRGSTVIETRFNGSYEHDFTDDQDHTWRFNETYAAWTNHEYGISALLGRESRSTDGVSGRYDGLRLTKSLTDQVSLNLIAGFPVESTQDSVDTDRPFYGVSLDLGNFYDRWDFNAFYIERSYDGLTDRQAVGGEFRYFKDGLSVFGLADYDISFSELNSALLLGNWVRGDSIVYFNIDFRKTPLLAIRNALLGQTETSLDGLKARFSSDEIRDLALRHTAESKFATLGYTYTLNPHHQVGVDVTASKISDIEGSELFPASPGTPTEYYYNLQWISYGMFKDNDNFILGARYEDLDRWNRYTMLLNVRLPVGSKWRLNPRLSWATSDSHDGLDERDKLKASFNAIYRFNRDTEFEVELGTEMITEKGDTFSGDTDIYYFFAGLRRYF